MAPLNNERLCTVDASFEEALAAFRSGEEWGAEQVWRSHQPRLVAFLTSRAGLGLAEDLASETWIRVARSISTFNGGESEFRAWLFSIARARVIDAFRQGSRRPEELTDSPEPEGESVDPASIVLSQMGFESLCASIRRLPPDQADVISLRVLGDMSAEEVGRMLGKPPGTIRVLQSRALTRLAREIEASGGPKKNPKENPKKSVTE